jgi:hypothetical protein
VRRLLGEEEEINGDGVGEVDFRKMSILVKKKIMKGSVGVLLENCKVDVVTRLILASCDGLVISFSA